MTRNNLKAPQKAQIIAAIRELNTPEYERIADKLERLDREPHSKAGFWYTVLWLSSNDALLCAKLAAIQTVQEENTRNIQTTTYNMALHTAMQAAFNYVGTTPCLTAFADVLCTHANTYNLNEIEKGNLIVSVCDELALLLQEGLK